MKPNLFHTQFFRLFFLILLAGISIQTYAAKDSQAAPKKRTITGTVISEGDNMPLSEPMYGLKTARRELLPIWTVNILLLSTTRL